WDTARAIRPIVLLRALHLAPSPAGRAGAARSVRGRQANVKVLDLLIKPGPKLFCPRHDDGGLIVIPGDRPHGHHRVEQREGLELDLPALLASEQVSASVTLGLESRQDSAKEVLQRVRILAGGPTPKQTTDHGYPQSPLRQRCGLRGTQEPRSRA